METQCLPSAPSLTEEEDPLSHPLCRGTFPTSTMVFLCHMSTIPLSPSWHFSQPNVSLLIYFILTHLLVPSLTRIKATQGQGPCLPCLCFLSDQNSACILWHSVKIGDERMSTGEPWFHAAGGGRQGISLTPWPCCEHLVKALDPGPRRNYAHTLCSILQITSGHSQKLLQELKFFLEHGGITRMWSQLTWGLPFGKVTMHFWSSFSLPVSWTPNAVVFVRMLLPTEINDATNSN